MHIFRFLQYGGGQIVLHENSNHENIRLSWTQNKFVF